MLILVDEPCNIPVDGHMMQRRYVTEDGREFVRRDYLRRRSPIVIYERIGTEYVKIEEGSSTWGELSDALTGVLQRLTDDTLTRLRELHLSSAGPEAGIKLLKERTAGMNEETLRRFQNGIAKGLTEATLKRFREQF